MNEKHFRTQYSLNSYKTKKNTGRRHFLRIFARTLQKLMFSHFSFQQSSHLLWKGCKTQSWQIKECTQYVKSNEKYNLPSFNLNIHIHIFCFSLFIHYIPMNVYNPVDTLVERIIILQVNSQPNHINFFLFYSSYMFKCSYTFACNTSSYIINGNVLHHHVVLFFCFSCLCLFQCLLYESYFCV